MWKFCLLVVFFGEKAEILRTWKIQVLILLCKVCFTDGSACCFFLGMGSSEKIVGTSPPTFYESTSTLGENLPNIGEKWRKSVGKKREHLQHTKEETKTTTFPQDSTFPTFQPVPQPPQKNGLYHKKIEQISLNLCPPKKTRNQSGQLPILSPHPRI